jgi:integrase/recombinase XerD
MLLVWRRDHSVRDSSAGVYLQWIKRFRAYCSQRNLDERTELTLAGARRFVAWYARHRHLQPRRLGGACTALYALSRVYHVMGLSPPAWQCPPRARRPATALLRAYADHLARCRGNPEVTVRGKLHHIEKLSEYLARRGKTCRTMTLMDIDEFLIVCAQRYARPP